jgi:hypothetical protein
MRVVVDGDMDELRTPSSAGVAAALTATGHTMTGLREAAELLSFLISMWINVSLRRRPPCWVSLSDA